MQTLDKKLAETIAKNIKKYREAKGISKNKMAEEANINRFSLIKYERGEMIPTINALIKIANYLEITVDELIR